jgi:hypothetical protein
MDVEQLVQKEIGIEDSADEVFDAANSGRAPALNELVLGGLDVVQEAVVERLLPDWLERDVKVVEEMEPGHVGRARREGDRCYRAGDAVGVHARLGSWSRSSSFGPKTSRSSGEAWRSISSLIACLLTYLGASPSRV